MLDEEMLRAFLRERERYFRSSIPIDAGLTFEKPTTKIKEDTMDEDLKKEEEDSSSIIEKVAKVRIKEEGDKVLFTILSQYLYRFRKHIIMPTSLKKIMLCSDGIAEFGYDGGCYWFFLKGGCDRHVRNKTITIPKHHFDTIWEHIKAFFDIEGEEIEDVPKKVGTKFSFDKKPTKKEIEEMISKVDLDTFTTIIKNRLYRELDSSDREHLADFNREWARKYLERWAKAKYRLYKIFGDRLIVEQDIEIKADRDEIIRKYLEITEKFPLLKNSLKNLGYNWVVENKLDGVEGYTVGSDPRVVNGMSFTKLIALYGNEELNIEISKLYQNLNKCKLSLSINPIDFLTVSINKSGWDSCHEFYKGAYRNAPLSYMFDTTSFVNYSSTNMVKHTTDKRGEKLKNPFEWNSKNWRQMAYSSPSSSVTVFSRQYPNDSEEKSKIVRKMFRDLYCAYFNCPNKWSVSKDLSKTEVKRKHQNLYNDVNGSHECKVIRNKEDAKFSANVTIDIASKITSFDSNKCVLDEDEELWQY